jgi:hypothetical protein
MSDIRIICSNDTNTTRSGEPVTIGVPFASGELLPGASLVLRDEGGRSLPIQSLPLIFWPDGSVRWLLCDFMADLPVAGEAIFRLMPGTAELSTTNILSVEQGAESWLIRTGKAEFSVDRRILRPYLQVRTAAGEVLASPAEVRLIEDQGRKWTPHIDRMTLEAAGPVRATLAMNGSFRRRDGKELLCFEARLHCYAGSSRSAFEIRLHNPGAARHPGNLWDLGDPASVQLDSWSVLLPLAAPSVPAVRLQTGTGAPWHHIDPAVGTRLRQLSSGGERWDSPAHRDRTGHVPLAFRGWRLTAGELELAAGLRAQPLIWWGGEQGGMSADIDHFWQRFPKGLTLREQEIALELLPGGLLGGHELQGGEQISERVRFDFSAPREAVAWGLPTSAVRCAPEVYRRTGVFAEGLWPGREERYAGLLATVLDDHVGFFAKREQIDEYGWRHFGELYADHEAAFHKEEGPFVSHYNNQYDPLASLYRQYLAGADRRWGDLARDLAAHVADIDINHTDVDREEYCRGLFWHTDHYLDAGLATHRMASREHLEWKNPALCGGGPAAEHCYTSGLKLHHLHSGDPRSRDLVLQLADWCWRSLHGPGTVGAALLRSVQSLVRWRREKQSAPIWPRYPFTRGTGNCLNAILDALELTGNRRYLRQAARLVRGTVHPEDRPGARDLLDAESRWSYTVFLAALGRYLQVKGSRLELDGDYAYGRAGLLTYARWMAEYEYPYLEKPEVLEYPNETWAAQDLRKSVVFYHGATHASGEERARFIERSHFFLDAGLDHLCGSGTRHYTRPLALLLQNGWTSEALEEEIPAHPPASGVAVGRPTPHLTLGEIVRRSLDDLLTVLPGTGPRREWAWLRARMGKA